MLLGAFWDLSNVGQSCVMHFLMHLVLRERLLWHLGSFVHNVGQNLERIL
jgi:hypothetical protein